MGVSHKNRKMSYDHLRNVQSRFYNMTNGRISTISYNNLIYKNEILPVCLSVCLLLYTNPQFTSDDREILHTGVVNSGRDN